MKMKSKGYSSGGKLKMVKNSKGEEVPFFAADGVGKMNAGGKTVKVPKTKGYFKGGKVMTKMAAGGGTGKTKARGCGAARQQMFTKNG